MVFTHSPLSEGERFWIKVDKTPGHGPWGTCWIWTAGKHHFGYGQFWVTALNQIDMAHRVAWRLSGNLLPPKTTGLMLRHQCHIPACVNPMHLKLGNMGQNMDDMKKAGRGNKKKGEDTGHAKATATIVISIRELAAAGETHKSLGKRFGLTRSAVGAIVTRRNWKHIP